MSGHTSGVQKLIVDKNPKFIFTNCDTHNLNLCGVHVSYEEPELATVFAAVERLWTFFSHSTLRWASLNKKLKYYAKQESETRWSARADAVEVVYKKYFELVNVLKEINEPDAFVSSPLDLLKFITEYGNDAFPELRSALQFMLTICTSIASCERSFSKLKLILTHLRSIMTQQRLCDLAQISMREALQKKLILQRY